MGCVELFQIEHLDLRDSVGHQMLAAWSAVV
jgi:hypothetical protein